MVNDCEIPRLCIFQKQIDVSDGFEPFDWEFDLQLGPEHSVFGIQAGKSGQKAQAILVIGGREIHPFVWRKLERNGAVIIRLIEFLHLWNRDESLKIPL